MNKESNYIDLLNEYLFFCIRSNDSEQKIKTSRSILKSWCWLLKISDKRCVHNELGENFNSYLALYAQELDKQGIKKSTKASRLSIMRAIRKFFLQKDENAPVLASFHKKLDYFLKLKGFSTNKFHKTFLSDEKITPITIRNWTSGKSTPLRTQRLILEKIEHCLGIPDGELISMLPWRGKDNSSFQLGSPSDNVSETKRRRHIRYSVKTEQFLAEFEELVKYKTAIIPSEKLKRVRRSIWTSSEGAWLPSADKALKDISYFLGFCALPTDAPDPKFRGLGIDEKCLTIALLADKNAVEKYLTEFRLARTGGKFHHGYSVFITLIISLLRKETGYLYQQPAFAGRLGLSLTKEEWEAKCLDTRDRLVKIKEAIEDARKSGGGFEMGRDPQKNIESILALPQPLEPTLAMTAKMFKDVPALQSQPRTQACLYRDALLLTLLQANPLRIRMFMIMKFDKNLVREKDGSWWIVFDRRDFKNRHSLSCDYKARLAPEIWRMIEVYREKYHPTLSARDNKSLHVFPNAITPRISWKPSEHSATIQHLSQIVFKRTKQYIDGCNGFRSHSFRHLVCTSIIKNNPEFGFFLAAKVLHDKLETVEKYYAHLKTSEFIEPYNRYFSNIWNKANPDSEDKSGNNKTNGGDGSEVI